jgi:hypothetical protein
MTCLRAAAALLVYGRFRQFQVKVDEKIAPVKQ